MYDKDTENLGNLASIDYIYAITEEDTAVLGLVTVGYIDGSAEMQKDFLDKMEGYLRHIHSNLFKVEYPQSNVVIEVSFEEKPDPRMIDLLYNCIPWCEENEAKLIFKIAGRYQKFVY